MQRRDEQNYGSQNSHVLIELPDEQTWQGKQTGETESMRISQTGSVKVDDKTQSYRLPSFLYFGVGIAVVGAVILFNKCFP